MDKKLKTAIHKAQICAIRTVDRQLRVMDTPNIVNKIIEYTVAVLG